MEINYWIYIFITIGTFIYLYLKHKYSYWENRRTTYLKPIFPFGNFKLVLQRKAAVTEVVQNIYDKVKDRGEKYGGIYAFLSPNFVPVDLDLVKCIVQKDFSHFTNHGLYINEEHEPLSAHLFNLENEKWRNLRIKLTPTFTSGKMKMMFHTMEECTAGLSTVLSKSAATNQPVDIKEHLACFTTDVIGSVAFGVDINSMENPESEFRKYGKLIFASTLLIRMKVLLIDLLPPWLITIIGVKRYTNDMEAFYINLVKDTVAHREQNNVYRKDFMHLLIQLRNTGQVSEDNDSNLLQKSNDNTKSLTLKSMAAQCFVFFLAGFETSATTMTFALLELAQRIDIQEKVRDEINKVLNKHGNKITYDSIMEMEYLEKVVLETLRKHPPIGALPRVCNKQYNVPNSDLIIESGTGVFIPVSSIHRDPDHFPNPEFFDPERFTEANITKRHPFAYMPFGEGPRACIGLRFGKLQSKVGLCTVLRNYRVTLNEKTQLPIKYETGFISAVKGGVWLDLQPITT